ncbi:FAD/NAD(P)-binding protein [Atopococcus tabaci]|uniref:FAD/NAD(P)-binding protein n=1 Tax=Atopococcus tabaci TaxID=269774 RepID=UPI000418DCDA|nr:FAD/NAD(P)-binding protein [Atopococcus tabaci]
MKIAIVGFGVSGAALLMSLNIAGKLDGDTQVDIFDPNNEPASGLAYGKDANHLFVNAFPTAMSLNPENKYEFSNWLESHYPEYDSRADLVPRTVFGEYAHERLTFLLEKENISHYKKEIADAVVLKEAASTSYLLEDLNGEQYGAYDYLFLAVGNPPYNDFYDLNGLENYIHNPYPVVEKLNGIEQDTKVAIIGSSLTAFDLVNYLSHEKDLQHPIGIFTVVPSFNSLRVPPYQGAALTYSLDRNWLEKEALEHKGVVPLDRIIDTIQQDLKANAIDLAAIRKKYDPADLEGTYHAYFNQEHPELSKLQAYIARLSEHLGDLYMSLSKEDQRRYHLDYAPLFNHYLVRLAPDAVANMYQLWNQEQLFVVPDLIDVNKNNTFALKSNSGGTYEADVVINASGFAFNTDRIGDNNPLLKNLLDKGFLLDKDKRGILVTWPECQVISQRYGQLDTCFFIGPWISNTHYGNNNVKALVEKAHEIVQKYMDS